jgi:hypothetical protein
MVGLLFFIALVAAVQIFEGWLRWYIHREDRVHLVALREELIDVGAEMIAAQLETERLREHLEGSGRLLYGGDHASDAAGRRESRVPPARITAHLHAAAGSDHGTRMLERNQHLTELNRVVGRRNAAAVRYYVLADSIRLIADRVQEPYFSIPLPVEAAVKRGIIGVVVPWSGASGDSLPQAGIGQGARTPPILP